jgi:hypothetical protein
MTWKHWLSVGATAFAGGVGGYITTHLGAGVPTTGSAVGAFALGAAIAGAAAVAHLLQPVPS